MRLAFLLVPLLVGCVLSDEEKANRKDRIEQAAKAFAEKMPGATGEVSCDTAHEYPKKALP